MHKEGQAGARPSPPNKWGHRTPAGPLGETELLLPWTRAGDHSSTIPVATRGEPDPLSMEWGMEVESHLLWSMGRGGVGSQLLRLQGAPKVPLQKQPKFYSCAHP